jgi:hypothetical protein
MARPRKPSDLLVANGFWIEMPGLVSPHFETLDGLGIESSDVMIVDAGTNIEYKFPTQIARYTELSLTRTLDGSSDDAALEELVQKCIHEGLKFDGTVVKTHWGKEAFRLQLVGFRFKTLTEPSLDVNGEEKYQQSLTGTIDYYYKL